VCAAPARSALTWRKAPGAQDPKNRRMKLPLHALLLCACCALGGPAPAQPVAASSETSAFAALVAARSACVVDVVALRSEREAGREVDEDEAFEFAPENDYSAHFAVPLPTGLARGQIRDLGSGVVLTSDGFILTSGHGIAGAEEVQVRLGDGRKFGARIVGTDRRTDVGLLKIETTGLPVAPIGDSSTLAAGDWVAAIGAPFGFHGSVTTGVVSATERYMAGVGEIPFVQTDVAINPGSSGSPLFNARGEVVAINSMIYSGSGGYMGLSFAVPINLAMRIARELRTQGRVRRAHLGVEVQEISPALAQSFGLPSAAGALVVRVDPDGPGAAAGLLRGDVVSALDGAPVLRFTDLIQKVALQAPGTRVRLDLWRRARPAVVWAELTQEARTIHPAADRAPPERNDGLGLVLAELSRAQREQLRIEEGLMVRSAGGAARSEGLRPGDLILAVNDRPVNRVAEFTRLVSRLAPGRSAALLVQRSGRTAYVPITLP